MNYSSKHYALALYESVKNKQKKDLKKILDNFFKVLVSNNNMSIAEDIYIEFSKIWNEKEGIAKTEIISAKKIDKGTLEVLNKYLLKSLGVKKLDMSTRIDESLLGGVILKYGDKILDGSLKTKLNTLKSKLKE